MKINVSQKDIIWSYLSNIFCMGSNFLLLPFVITYLNGEELGLWYVFLSVGGLANLFDFGFSVTLARNITYCWVGAEKLEKNNCKPAENKETNFYLMKKVLITSKYIYGFISILVTILLLIFGTMYIYNLTSNLNNETRIISWVIYIVSVTVNIFYGYYFSFLYGVGAIEIANKNRVYARIVQIAVTVLSLMLGYGIIGMCVSNLIYGFVFRWLGKSSFYSYKNIGGRLKHINNVISNEEKLEIFKIVWYNAWRDGVILISSYCTDQFTILLCSMYISLTETGKYSLANQIITAIVIFSGIVYNAYQPKLQAAWASGDKQSIKETMGIIVFAYITLFSVGLIGFVLVVHPVLMYFKPQSMLSLYMCLLICLYQFLVGLRNCYTSYFSCSNRLIYMRAFCMTALVFCMISIYLEKCFKLGVLGVVLAQLISQTIFNFWYWIKKGNEEMQTSLISIFMLGFERIKVKFVGQRIKT